MIVVCECGVSHKDVKALPFFCFCGKRNAVGLPSREIKEPTDSRVGKCGTELKKLIPKFFSSKECNCSAYATRMDDWGVDGCLSRFNEIVDHLVKQASETRVIKHFPGLNRYVAQAWLTKAIENAKASAKETQSIDNGEWFVAMTTAPRIDCTLKQSIDSMRQAGWEPIIFAEPGSTTTDAETICHESKKGVWFNWLASARYAIENTNASLILTVQDDSLFHPESRDYTEHILWPHKSAGFLSLYTPKHYSLDTAGKLKQTGVNQIKTSSLWGACALVWPRDVLAAAIETPIAKNWKGVRPKSGNPAVMEARRQNPSLVANSDTAIGRMVTSLGKTMWFVDPSPVSHIAIHSTIKHGGNTGRRNCLRCADHSISLFDQAPRYRKESLPKTHAKKECAIKFSICIPLKVTDDDRLRNWETIYSQISRLAKSNDWEIVVAEHGGYHAMRDGCKRVEVEGEFTRSKARNAAWHASSGNLICFLDSDIFLSNRDWLQCIKDAAEMDAYSPSKQYDRQNKDGSISTKQKRFTGGIFFCKRRVLEKCKGWDERFEQWGSEDNALDQLLESGGFNIRRGTKSVTHLYHSYAQRVGFEDTEFVFEKYYRGKPFGEVVEAMDNRNDETEKRFSSHETVLRECLSKLSAGDVVIEFGVGKYSTPIIKDAAESIGFDAHCYETEDQWLYQCKRDYASDRLTFHNLNPSKLPMIDNASLVFIDAARVDGRASFRNEILSAMADAKTIICHDTEDDSYGYDFSEFPKASHHWSAGVRTTVVSS